MNLFTVLIPYLFAIVALLLLLPLKAFVSFLASKTFPSIFRKSEMGAGVADKKRIGIHYRIQMEYVFRFVFSGLFFLVLIYTFISYSPYFIRANPSINYQSALRNSTIVIAFGFGIEKDKNGNLTAGVANDSIMNWISENTHAKYIIAQKGCALSKFINSETQLVEMHPHNDSVYINTFEAAGYALNKLDSLYKTDEMNNNQILVVAHDMQLERAAWILKKMYEKRNNKSSYQFIIPKMTSIPFPLNSSQLHTRSIFIYNLIELYISRPRDYFHLLFIDNSS